MLSSESPPHQIDSIILSSWSILLDKDLEGIPCSSTQTSQRYAQHSAEGLCWVLAKRGLLVGTTTFLEGKGSAPKPAPQSRPEPQSQPLADSPKQLIFLYVILWNHGFDGRQQESKV